MRMVTKASARFATLPKPGEPGAPPPPIHRPATGTSVSPIMVMRQPITTGGKNRMSRAMTGARSTMATPAPMTAPKTERTP